MGSQSRTNYLVNLAYIAGFLDGDGSLMLQIKKRKDGRLKRRFMSTICFYQDSRHERPLKWIRKMLRIGYLSRRNDGISELRINGFRQVQNILKELLPFIRFKKKQAQALYRASVLLSRVQTNRLSRNELRTLVNYILIIQGENYITKRKKSRKELIKLFSL